MLAGLFPPRQLPLAVIKLSPLQRFLFCVTHLCLRVFPYCVIFAATPGSPLSLFSARQSWYTPAASNLIWLTILESISASFSVRTYRAMSCDSLCDPYMWESVRCSFVKYVFLRSLPHLERNNFWGEFFLSLSCFHSTYFFRYLNFVQIQGHCKRTCFWCHHLRLCGWLWRRCYRALASFLFNPDIQMWFPPHLLFFIYVLIKYFYCSSHAHESGYIQI